MSKHEIIQGYVLSDKSQWQQEKQQIYTFSVHPKANKFQIKRALEDQKGIFQVKVKTVRTSRLKFKRRNVSLLRKFPGSSAIKTTKKAFVQLFPGYRLSEK